MTGIDIVHLPTKGTAFPHDGTNTAAIAASLGNLAYREYGRLIVKTPQGHLVANVGDVVIFDQEHNEAYPITAERYATNWAPAGEGS